MARLVSSGPGPRPGPDLICTWSAVTAKEQSQIPKSDFPHEGKVSSEKGFFYVCARACTRVRVLVCMCVHVCVFKRGAVQRGNGWLRVWFIVLELPVTFIHMHRLHRWSSSRFASRTGSTGHPQTLSAPPPHFLLSQGTLSMGRQSQMFLEEGELWEDFWRKQTSTSTHTFLTYDRD